VEGKRVESEEHVARVQALKPRVDRLRRLFTQHHAAKMLGITAATLGRIAGGLSGAHDATLFMVEQRIDAAEAEADIMEKELAAARSKKEARDAPATAVGTNSPRRTRRAAA
jgi:hypothetical protein